jgi:hypothetical protein
MSLESHGDEARQFTKAFGEKLVMVIGVDVPTGLGDGIYPVIAQYHTSEGFGRRILSIYIDFRNPMRGTGCPVGRDWPHKLSKACWRGSVEPEARKERLNAIHDAQSTRHIVLRDQD